MTAIIKQFNNNRWYKFVIYGLALTFLSCIYSGWSYYQLLYIKGNIFAWVCPDSYIIGSYNFTNVNTCPTAQTHLQRLYFVIVAFELLFSLPAGYLFDKYGTKVCFSGGFVLSCLYFICLISKLRNTAMLYFLSLIQGCFVNLIAYPALELQNYFTNNVHLVLSYIVACQTASSMVPIIMWESWKRNPSWKFEQIFLVYLIGITIPLSILYYCSLTNTKFAKTSNKVILNMSEIMASLKTKQFIFATIISILANTLGNYWISIALGYFGTKVNNFLGYITPTQILWSITFGIFADCTSPLFVIGIIFVLFQAVYFCAYWNTVNLQIICASIVTLILPFTYTFKYAYLQTYFPEKIYGTLVGLCGTLNGIGLLLATFATNMNYNTSFSVMSSLALCGTILTIAQYKSDSKRASAIERVQLHLNSIEKIV